MVSSVQPKYIFDEDILDMIEKYPPKNVVNPEPGPITRDDLNPFRRMYGENVFHQQWLQKSHIVFPDTSEDLPPLPPIRTLDELDFDWKRMEIRERISDTKNSIVYKVAYDNEVYALKVIHYGQHDVERYKSWWEYRQLMKRIAIEHGHTVKDLGKPFTIPIINDRVEYEVDAYEKLVAAGLAMGQDHLAPFPYGVHHFAYDDQEYWKEKDCNLYEHGGLLEPFLHDPGSPSAILLQLIEDAEPLSMKNITFDLAKEAMRAVHRLNYSHIRHDDLDARNFLVVGGKQIMIVDFDRSKTSRCARMGALTCSKQIWQTWAMLFKKMLPDKYFENVKRLETERG